MDKELSIKIKALIQGAKEVAGLAEDVRKLGSEGRKPIPDPTENMRNGARQTKSVIQDLTNEMLAFVTAGAILKFAKDSKDAFAQAESAFRGLEAVANASGFGVANALKEAEKLAADGLISVAEASKALQNLLSRGYSLDQAVTTLDRLKDSAAFNRAAHLSLGEAVVTASEGLKNENSILVDNAGVTKNVAKMWEDYASKIGVTTNNLTQQQKIEAEYQGILAETQAQLGNAQKALEGFQGQQAEADQGVLKFQQSLGELLAPALLGVSKIGTWVIENIFKPIVFLTQLWAVRIGQVATGVGHLFDAIKSGNFSGLSDALKRDADVAEELLQDYAKRLDSGMLDITKSLKGGEDAQKITDNALKRAAANGDEQKKLTQDRIKDYEKLRDAIRKAWEDSLQAEKDYLAEAKKLRAEANAFNAKSLAGASPQEIATKEISLRGDLSIAQQRLQRKVSEGGSLDDIRAQAAAVQELADQYRSLTDVVEQDADKAAISQRADEAVKQSKLSLADALEKAAGEEHQRQQDQQQVLADVEKTLAEFEKPRTVNVVADQAKQAVQEVKAALDQVQDKTVTVTVQVKKGTAVDPALQLGSSEQFGIPSVFPAFADGGILPGYSPHDRADNIMYMGTAGEGLVNRPAMRYYGAEWLNLVNKQLLPRFADGGVLGSSAVSRISMPSLSQFSLGGASGMDRGTFVLPGGERIDVQAKPDVFDRLERAALMHGGIR